MENFMQTISPVFGVALILTKTLFARLMRSPLSSVPFFKSAFSPVRMPGIPPGAAHPLRV